MTKMKRASKFQMAPGWLLLLTDMGVDIQRVLTYAALPSDLFQRKQVLLRPDEYFSLWKGVEQALPDQEVPLLLAKHLTVEAFDAPIFAAICSPNMKTAVKRLQQYKPLIGPMELQIEETSQSTRLTISCYGYTGTLPKCLGLSELVFFTQLMRLATRSRILPLSVQATQLPDELSLYTEYFGCEVASGADVCIEFGQEDMEQPFLTSNAAMWDFFAQQLRQKLADVEINASISERVHAVLLEALPSGESSIEYVAGKLAVSKRTLQRKLSGEAETFQSILQGVRQQLADHYLKKSQLSLGEISFLLGFQEQNSFVRAYTSWHGVSPGSLREHYH
ncbi:AraC family transcriptional regulator [Pleionea sp. CnH1-48]|uniref:AraC family transcriptional regulator n=1 Tax=Pleionea sp. CnH1-48 TaxID=2954494 RepID=UPI002097971F|nr:AraC family transcriptional regulator [Pleionea sp. CnH1-48]MCO7224875.1 AraC family transcriptional regulator [Pleionea sp. CnH1-48]